MAQITIPWQSLSSDALNAVIEEFVTREGTEYGVNEVSLDAKCIQVLTQLQAGGACITYDEALMTCSISMLE